MMQLDKHRGRFSVFWDEREPGRGEPHPAAYAATFPGVGKAYGVALADRNEQKNTGFSALYM